MIRTRAGEKDFKSCASLSLLVYCRDLVSFPCPAMPKPLKDLA